MENRNIWVYDIETCKSCFTYTGFNIDTKEIKQFVLHKDKWELHSLLLHLNDCKGQIGFNNLNFDYSVLHYMLKNSVQWISKLLYEDIILLIYNEAQRIINLHNQPGVYTSIKEQDVLINQLDLFQIWHYSNKARSTSLKALQISMNYPNVQDMPINHNKEDISLLEVKEILEYNLNDVMSTYQFYLETIKYGKIDLRKKLQNKFGLNCINWNNGKIGENLILKLYCDETGKNIYDVRKLRTKRDIIHLKDCIPNNIVFKTNEFNSFIEVLKNTTIKETKGEFTYSIIYKQHKYDFAQGGLHGIHYAGIYESNDKYVIKSLDVASLHPNLPLVYGFYPEHLGPEFLKVYGENIVNVRLIEKAKPKELRDNAIIDGYKEAANVPYGKSNEEFSFLYDPLYTMKTTIASQLVLSMLCERLANIENSQMLMSNTDGCEIIIPRNQEHIYDSICRQWMQETKLVLEFNDYQKMWIRDINNYGCLDMSGKIKNKGCFEVDKKVGNEPAFHKDNSFRITPLALENYFSKGIDIKQTIKNHTNIYDFCGRQKFKGLDFGQTHEISLDNNGLPTEIIQKQQKNLRYYISNKGKTLVKKYSKGSIEFIHKNYYITIFNKFEIKSNYNINYDWYIKETQRVIDTVEIKQLELF